ncbi:c-type cytochrome [Chondrinema litorale]|uniref:c-type cytochrome n=1 Tax=Chondrinema litorale TaxID=2994555 RepID=UPI002542CD0A|nr:c-type cytochrome [Chondrinema litorale]UZR99294.1 c-type cytochrome [Chondrinema litorale]
MKINNNYTLYFSLGFFVGIICFLLSHEYYPMFFHQEEEAANKITQTKPWRIKSIRFDLPENNKRDLIEYGYEIITKSSQHIGPLAKNPTKRFAGNNLSCSNCHLDAGKKIGAGSFVGITHRFPQFRGRENKIGTLKERVNGCMERSMNGKKLSEYSVEMEAIIAYMEWLSEDVPEDVEKLYKGYVKIQIPEYKADPIKGKSLYLKYCRQCHMEDGQGFKTPGDTFNGYIYPPVGGLDSFNDGAGMNRVLTAAQFIKGNMPFGATYDKPIVSDEEAYHIAAYINTLKRPEKPHKEVDFPDKKLKPVSTPYAPWTDNFTQEQHKFGPFPPIIEYYKKEFGINKSK